MPEEQDIEKKLRAYAKHRREAGGPAPELHPATRRLFQAEVARLKRVTRSDGFAWGWLWASPARTWAGVATVAILIAAGAVWISLSGRAPYRTASVPMAKAAPAASEPSNTPAGPLLAQAARQVQFQANSNQEPRDKGPASGSSANVPIASAPGAVAPAPAPSSVGGPVATAAPLTAALAATIQPTSSGSPSVAPASPGGTLDMSERSSLAAARVSITNGLTRQFNRSGAIPPSAPMDLATRRAFLSSFHVEQAGDQLRVIDDNDGSVYTGVLTNAPAPASGATVGGADGSPPEASFARTNEAVAQQRANALAATSGVGTNATNNSVAIPNYTFTVSGTNLTLNQLVVMSGTVGPNIPGLARRGGRGSGGDFGGARGGGGGFGGGAPPQNTPTNGVAGGAFGGRRGRGGPAPAFQLRGTVTIGTNQFPLNAAPAAQ